MMKHQGNLADLDELVLLCRDERARAYIAEAASCYRAGAYRSAIVATWIAVCYDVIDKLRELTLAGDKEAESLVESMDKARAANDIAKALKFERELLEHARDKFELISHIEFLDLDRLQQDRNRCAHPSLSSDEEAFNPSAELARLHIRSAVTHLLQHPPVQGKYALERLVNEVQSDYFPTERDKAIASLKSGPLRNPRESLTRNFTVVLLKSCLSEGVEWKARRRYLAALLAVEGIHSDSFRSTVAEKVTAIFRATPDGRLHLVTWLLAQVHQLWEATEVDVRNRIENYVLALPEVRLDDAPELLRTPFLAGVTARRINHATRAELSKVLFFDLHEVIADRFLHLYCDSKNYDQANSFGKQIAIYAADFSVEQQRRLILDASQNGQIVDSFEFGSVIAALRQSEVIPGEQFEDLLGEAGLERYQLLPEA
ncbi:MAG: hypothetical protein AB1344_01935 [Pseudomonadota bacterium]